MNSNAVDGNQNSPSEGLKAFHEIICPSKLGKRDSWYFVLTVITVIVVIAMPIAAIAIWLKSECVNVTVTQTAESLVMAVNGQTVSWLLACLMVLTSVVSLFVLGWLYKIKSDKEKCMIRCRSEIAQKYIDKLERFSLPLSVMNGGQTVRSPAMVSGEITAHGKIVF